MNTQTQEALKMAIEWMDKWHDKEVIVMDVGTRWVDFSMAIKACKEALAQPAQEPEAWATEWEDGEWSVSHSPNMGKQSIPLYTNPAPAWQGLSDDEIFELHHKWIMNSGNKDTQYDFARAIEQALKEKNT